MRVLLLACSLIVISALAAAAVALPPANPGVCGNGRDNDGDGSEFDTGCNDYYQWHLTQVNVNCSVDQGALTKAWKRTLDKSQISYRITGRCEAPDFSPYLGLSAQGRNIKIAGQDNGSGCVDGPKATLFSNNLLSLGANQGGHLWLNCLRMEAPAESAVTIGVFGNSYVRVGAIEFVNSNGIVSVNDGGVFRYFGAGETAEPYVTTFNSVRGRNNATLAFAGPVAVRSMMLQGSKADFVYRLTPLSLGDVALYGSGIVIRETDNADLSGSLTVQFDSTLTYKNRSDGSDFYDPGLLNLGPDSRIYTY